MKHSNRARVIALAAGAAALSSMSLFSGSAEASIYSWGLSPGTSVMNTAANWSPAVLPTNNDDTFFGPSSATSLTLTGNLSFFSMTFNANAPAYTIGAPGGTASILLGTSTLTGGTLTNNSSFTQTINTSWVVRKSTINAASADIIFNGPTFNVGNNGTGATTAGRNITITGSHNVTINSQLLGSVTPFVTGIPDDDITNIDNGRLIKDGSGTLFLTNNGNNSNFTGPITVDTGAVQASAANAFGAFGSVTISGANVVLGATHVSGGINTGRVELIGGISFAPETLVLEGRSVSDTQLANVGGNNTWTGVASLTTGGGSYAISSDSGNLTMSGNIINTTGTNGVRTLAFRGASNGIVSGNIIEGPGSSNLSPFKDGTGMWTFIGSNNYTGVTTVNQGTLQIGNGGTSGNLGSGSVALGGGNLVFNRSDAISVTNPISGTGTVIVQAGTTGFSTGAVTGGAFAVNDGAAMTLNSSGPTSTMTVSNLTLGNTTGSVLNFSLGTAGNSTAPVITAGGLTRNGNIVVNLQGSNFSVGTITLIQNTGAETGTGTFTVGTLPNRVLASVFDTGSKVDLDITGIDFPKWTGAANNNWDTTNNSPPKDWVLNSNGTTPTDYIEGDSVLFDDSSSVGTVNVSNNVAPNAVTVNNSSTNYTFTGGGGITGAATLTKTGTRTLTIANDGNNTFTGTISIGAGGTLAIGAGATNGNVGSGTIVNTGNLVMNRQGGLGLANGIQGSGNLVVRANSVGTLSGNNSYGGTTTVEAGAVLAINSATSMGSTTGATVVQSTASLYTGAGTNITFAAEPMTVNGTGNGQSQGAIHAAGNGVTSTFTGAVTLGSPVTLGSDSGAVGNLNGQITGAGLNLTIDGGGTWQLGADGNSYGNTIVNNGTLEVGSGAATGSIGSGTVEVASSGTFGVNRTDAYTFPTLIDGAGAVVNDGTGTLTLAGNNTFTGPVYANRGVIRITSASVNSFGIGNKNLNALSRLGGFELDGGVTVPSALSFQLSNDGTGAVPFAIHSATGTNVINGNITMLSSPVNGVISSLIKVDSGGTLIINGNITTGDVSHQIQLGGSGTGIVNGIISDGANAVSVDINGTGQPTWILAAPNTMSANVNVDSGTLVLMNSQALGFTISQSCFIGKGTAAAAGVAATLSIGTDGLNVTNGLWTNKDGAGLGAGENFERNITFSGASGTGIFSGSLQVNGGAVFSSTSTGTLVMSGVIQNGGDTSGGVKRDVFVNSAGTIVFSGNNTYTGFTEMDAGTLNLTSATAQSLILTGTGGADIRGGRMVFDYGASGSGDPLASIRPLLQTSLAANFAAGQLRVGNATTGIGIGYIDDTAGQKLQLLRTYLGDANNDGTVNALDFNAVATNFGTTGNAVWTQGDFNYDGNVDTNDFMMLANDFGDTLAAPPAPPVLGTLVPEPTMLTILPASALLVLCKRARRSRRR